MLLSNCSLPAQHGLAKPALGSDCAVVLQYDDAWQTSVKDFIYLPAKQAYARGASATNTDRIEAARGKCCSCWDTPLPSKEQRAPRTGVSCWSSC